MLLDQAMNIMEKFFNELREAPPEKRDHFVKIGVNFFELAVDALQTSPEFRKGFLKAHTEFLKYPDESREIMEKCLEAYHNLFPTTK